MRGAISALMAAEPLRVVDERSGRDALLVTVDLGAAEVEPDDVSVRVSRDFVFIAMHEPVVGRSVDRSVGSIARSIGRSVSRLVGRTLGRSVGRSVGRSIDRSVDRLIGRWVDRSVARSVRPSVSKSERASRAPAAAAPACCRFVARVVRVSCALHELVGALGVVDVMSRDGLTARRPVLWTPVRTADRTQVRVNMQLPEKVAVDEADARFFEVLKSRARARSQSLASIPQGGHRRPFSFCAAVVLSHTVPFRELTRARAILGRGGPPAAVGCRVSRPKESGELKVMMPLADADEVGVHIGLPAGIAVDEADARFFEVLKSCVRGARARSLTSCFDPPRGSSSSVLLLCRRCLVVLCRTESSRARALFLVAAALARRAGVAAHGLRNPASSR